MISEAWSLFGNILPPRSSRTGQPFSVTKRIISSFDHEENAERKNFGLVTIFEKKSSPDAVFVKLHLPFPVI